MRKTVTVICSRCGKNKTLYGIRTEKTSGRWYFTWAFPLKDSVAKNEGWSDTVINESPSNREDFNGCPYCKSKALIYCSNCHQLNCYNSEEYFTCAWCGQGGTVSNTGWGSLSGGGY